MTPQDLDAAKKQAEFERLMTAAHVHRRRGDYGAAETAVSQALELCPADLDAQEFAADMLFARGELEVASDAYKRMFESDSSRISAEKKYAQTIIQISEGRRQQDLLRQMIENPGKYSAPKRSALIAFLISIAPGFGQIYCGQFNKGIVLFTTTMIAWFLFAVSTPDVSGLDASHRLSVFLQSLSPLSVILACIATFIHIYAMVDAPVYISKHQQSSDPKSLSEPRA
ncbi:MAG: tetratricopeptide repeat protein [Armatimonadota bacterium]|nr:hypothetical protein [bacterium]